MSTPLLPRAVLGWLAALAIANAAGYWAFSYHAERASLQAEARMAATVLAGSLPDPASPADAERVRRRLAAWPGFRALALRDAPGQGHQADPIPEAALAAAAKGQPWTGGEQGLLTASAPRPHGGVVAVSLDAAPLGAAARAALPWALLVGLGWLAGGTLAALLFTTWWRRQVRRLVATAAGGTWRRARIREVDALGAALTMMNEVLADAGARRRRARFEAERERGEPELASAHANATIAPAEVVLAGRRVAVGPTPDACGAFYALAEAGGRAALVVGMTAGADRLQRSLEADAARRLATALLADGRDPDAAMAQVAQLCALQGWAGASWTTGGPLLRHRAQAAPSTAELPLVISTFDAQLDARLAAYAGKLDGLPPAELRQDLARVVAAGSEGAVAVIHASQG